MAARTLDDPRSVIARPVSEAEAEGPRSQRSPAMIAVALVAAACVAVSVTNRIYNPDLWQHLVVGKAIWQLHRVPTTQLWSWPTFGAPDVNWTWGFSALVWPVWERGGVWGLFAWRWVTTLLAFGLLWAAARRMGARGLVPLLVMVVCSLVWRGRSQVRPETLVAVLLAAQVWILETRRHGRKDRSWWLIPVAWAWANVHNTWFLGFGVIASHLLHDLVSGRGREAGDRWRLAWVGLVALAISFVNPFGWRMLWQPFDFFLNYRNEAIFSTIGEIGPIDWKAQWPGVPVLFAAWPLLTLVRMRRKGWDLVEAVLCLLFSAIALLAQRFLGLYSLVAAPYIARDLDEWIAVLTPIRRVPVALRASLASLACVAVGLPRWTQPGQGIGIGIMWNQYAVAACDFMEVHGVGGRGFSQFDFAGYQLYRFWPDRTRLPFMDIHQAGTKLDRDQYAWAQQRGVAWSELDHRHQFDYALLAHTLYDHSPLLDVLDADSTWALVFLDDVMALYVRRVGPLAGVAREFAYRHLPAGSAGLGPLGEACVRDSVLRASVVAELAREVDSSAYHAHALIVLANIALYEARFADARDLLKRSLALDPIRSGVHQRLAIIALHEGRPRDALREVTSERRLVGPGSELEVLAGRAWWALGDRERARDAFRRAVARDSSNAEARESLEAIVGLPRPAR